jgi:acyl dehydratase
VALTREAILATPAQERTCSWTAADASLYGLAVGAAEDPLDPGQLAFVQEAGLTPFPTFAAALTRTPALLQATGIDFSRVVHADQVTTFDRVLPASAQARVSSRVAAAEDWGARGALVTVESTLRDAASGARLATTVNTVLARGNPDIGGPAAGDCSDPRPNRPPDRTVAIDTRPNQALLYRLTGDLNPLHVDPVRAREVGFDRPILHGMCVYAVALRAMMGAYAGYDPARIVSHRARFAAPVYPGDRLAFDLWRDGASVYFEARVEARGVTVLKRGRTVIAPGSER